MSPRPLLVVGGVGDGSGTGAATARVFSKAGYSVALIARGASGTVQKLADELNGAGGEAVAFPVASYSYTEIHTAFEAIQKHWPNSELRVALYNVAAGIFKGFLDVTEQDIATAVDVNVNAAYSFAREVILRQKTQELDANGVRGTLIFTGASASTRGNKLTSGFAPGKHSLRALSQSLAKEFSQQNIHVAHSIIDGAIGTKKQRDNHDEKWNADPDNKVLPESIAKAYLYLANQDRSAWTWELDLRPAHETW